MGLIASWKLQLLKVLEVAAVIGGGASLLVNNLMGSSHVGINSLSLLLLVCNAVILLLPEYIKLRWANELILLSSAIMWAFWPLALYGLEANPLRFPIIIGIAAGTPLIFGAHFTTLRLRKALGVCLLEGACLLAVLIPVSELEGIALGWPLAIMLMVVWTVYIGILFVFTRLFGLLYKAEREVQEFSDLALQDDLTKIANRRSAEAMLTHILQQAAEVSQAFSVLLIDIDHFKGINDSYGHVVGDHVLKEFAEYLKEQLRADDMLARWGGEEFLVVILGNQDERLIAHRLHEGVKEANFSVPHLSFSAGVTRYKTGDTMLSLLERADKALYKAKENGRNQVVYADYSADALSMNS